jgi:hypothetical protein
MLEALVKNNDREAAETTDLHQMTLKFDEERRQKNRDKEVLEKVL